MDILKDKLPLGNTGLNVPPIIFGTSSLGNLYQTLPYKTKLEIVQEMFNHVEHPVVLDSAGKYGAGLALEIIGKTLLELSIEKNAVIISNKLGWLRKPLTTMEPTFEPGAWVDLKHDAKLDISYQGIMRCWDQGCEFLGTQFKPNLVSVHDPDEYLAMASTDMERDGLFSDIVNAYRGLIDLKNQGETCAVGVGAKDWKTIRRIADVVDLDWVMFAISFTIYKHPSDLMVFMDDLNNKNIGIINSAVFHTGFLTGGEYFDYKKLNQSNPQDKKLFQWREVFWSLCKKFNISPADACVQFAKSHPAVASIALNTSKPQRVRENINSVAAEIPKDFWDACKREGLISAEYPYV
jgi:D-threo-aldose 1-dehydrogenase